MRTRLALLALILLVAVTSHSQQIAIPSRLSTSDSSLFRAMPDIARQVLAQYAEPIKERRLESIFRYQLAANQYREALASLDSVGRLQGADSLTLSPVGIQFRSYALTWIAQQSSNKPFEQIYPDTLAALFDRLHLEDRSYASSFFASDPARLRTSFDELLAQYAGRDSLNISEARSLVHSYNSWNVYSRIIPLSKAFFAAEDRKNYIITDSLLIPTRDGARLSIVIVRPRKYPEPLPVVLMYNIYAGEADLGRSKQAADAGYVGIVLNTRGKKLSPQNIEPFEHDARDAYDAIDWISRQPWCNGKIGMYGGSYLGFSQWSAVKQLHPALKTIVPQVAVGIGIDYPMAGNIFMSYMLRWIHYVSNNKLTDYPEFSNSGRWDSLYARWYKSGRSFRALDTLDGRPNAIFQRWLDHPAHDAFWQAMVPYGKEFGNINIPVLTTTGYFDDDQRGAFYYLTQHLKWNPKAEHYVLIGPWDHGSAQSRALNEILGYPLDSVAVMSINETVFKWFDHILKDSALPPMLKDRINFEVAGSNEWRSAASLRALSNDSLVLYLSDTLTSAGYRFAAKKPARAASIVQEVSYADRNERTVSPEIVLSDKRPNDNRLLFISQPLARDMILNGSFSGALNLTIDRKDVDLIIDLYELQPDGRYFSLSHWYCRASYAADPSRRRLLQPGRMQTILINNSFFMSRKLSKGSRIVMQVGMNKSPDWQINYGTGKDVSAETIADGQTPLHIQWHNSSYIRLPLLK